jgi:hypothetical protein
VSDNALLHDNLRAIMLDTNAMGDGSLNMNTLRELPKITTKFPGLEIWIPEPVIWEWASHAQQTYTNAVIASRSATRKLAQAGIESGLSVPSEDLGVQAQVIALLESLGPPFQILRLHDYPEVAVDALRDQILQTPPAKLKSGVKTGAADIASLQLAQAEADSNGVVYAVVSSDGDIHRALREWGISDVTIFPNLKVLREALLAFQPLEVRLITPLLEAVSKVFEHIRGNVASLGRIEARGVIEEALAGEDDLLSTDVEIEHLGQILLLRSLELDQESGYGTAEVIATGDVQVTGLRMDDRGDDLVSVSSTVYDALLAIAITFTAGETIEDLQIESVTAIPNRDCYDNSGDALDALVGITAEVPGLETLVGDDGRLALSMGRQWEGEVNGKHVRATLQPHLPKDSDFLWFLEIDVSGQKAEATCYTRDTWTGRGDYSGRVGLMGDDAPAEFSLARFALSAIYGRVDDTPDNRARPHA